MEGGGGDFLGAAFGAFWSVSETRTVVGYCTEIKRSEEYMGLETGYHGGRFLLCDIYTNLFMHSEPAKVTWCRISVLFRDKTVTGLHSICTTAKT